MTSSKGEHILHNWFIKPLLKAGVGGVLVEGTIHLSNVIGQTWHSSQIIERLSSRCVKTKSGTKYVLEGSFQSLEARHAGFSQEVIEQFSSGFPLNWNDVIQNHFRSELDVPLEQTEKSVKDKSEEQSSKASSELNRFMHDTPLTTATAKSNSKTVKSKRPLRESDNTNRSKAKKARKTKKPKPSQAASVCDLSGFSLQYSRSGRTLKPRMSGAALVYSPALDAVVMRATSRQVYRRVGNKVQQYTCDPEKMKTDEQEKVNELVDESVRKREQARLIERRNSTTNSSLRRDSTTPSNRRRNVTR